MSINLKQLMKILTKEMSYSKKINIYIIIIILSIIFKIIVMMIGKNIYQIFPQIKIFIINFLFQLKMNILIFS